MSFSSMVVAAASRSAAPEKKAKPALKKMPKAKVKLCEECEKPEAECECEKEE